ncbi:MAG: hypothetical protein AB1758_06050 [Candidatus Eremiobacterota bacterium]
MEGLKQFTWHFVIQSRALATQQHGQRRVLRYLFEAFLDSAKSDGSIWPRSYQQVLEDCRCTERPRLVADLISGLSDLQAMRYFRRLSGLAPGSALEPPPS